MKSIKIDPFHFSTSLGIKWGTPFCKYLYQLSIISCYKVSCQVVVNMLNRLHCRKESVRIWAKHIIWAMKIYSRNLTLSFLNRLKYSYYSDRYFFRNVALRFIERNNYKCILKHLQNATVLKVSLICFISKHCNIFFSIGCLQNPMKQIRNIRIR